MTKVFVEIPEGDICGAYFWCNYNNDQQLQTRCPFMGKGYCRYLKSELKAEHKEEFVTWKTDIQAMGGGSGWHYWDIYKKLPACRDLEKK